jgi:hypothetical protein
MAGVTEDVVKELATLSRTEGRQRLVAVLGWREFNETDLQQSIHLDCLYDNIIFCVDRGFSWPEICQIHNLVCEMLDGSRWRNLLTAITFYRTLCSNIEVDDHRLVIFTEFFFATFMTHYRLYQFVMTSPPCRQTVSSQLTLPVHCPPVPVPELNSGMAPEIWNYDKALHELEKQEAEMKEMRRCEKFANEKVDAATIEAVKCSTQRLDTPIDTQTVLEIIQKVAGAHICAASHIIQQSINEAMDDINFKLEKTALPRPHALGPPLRYETKSPILLQKGQRSTSFVKDSAVVDKKSSALSRSKKLVESQH